MAITCIADAQSQYQANTPWQASISNAQNALQAVEYLLINRPQRQGDAGSELNYESLAKVYEAIQKFLGATAPRAFGRRRRVGVSFGRNAIQ